MENKRIYKFDNIKALLIFFVVLCHMFELFEGNIRYRMYNDIYSFHMPLFIVISGYFCRFNMKKYISRIIFPYFLFETLYLLFTDKKIDYLTPHWLMWYMFVLAIWYITAPLIKNHLPFVLVVSIVFSIAIGFFDDFGTKYSLSRLVTFYPYFVGGMLLKKHEKSFLKTASLKKAKKAGIACIAAAFLLLIMFRAHLNCNWFYGLHPYSEAKYTFYWRILLEIIAFLWICGILILVPDKKIKVFTHCGTYCICTYLLHGFIQEYFMNYHNIFIFGDFMNLFLSFVVSVITVLLFSNKHSYRILKYFFDLESWGKLIKEFIHCKRFCRILNFSHFIQF